MMRVLVLRIGILLLALNITSCFEEPEFKTYDKHGVRFNIPDDWKAKEMPITQDGHYIIIEKQSENPDEESGQFIISILEKSLLLDSYMQLMRDQLTQQMSILKTEIKFTKTEYTEFAGKEGLKSNFMYEQEGRNYRGELLTFNCNEKTIYLLKQEAEEDAVKNAKGFDLIRNSLVCTN